MSEHAALDRDDSATLLGVARRFFEDNGWPYTRVEGEPVLSLDFRGGNGEWRCFALARDEQAQFVFYSICPINVPAARRAAVAELLTRVNHDLFVGNFELDWSSGDVRCRTSIDLNGDRLSAPLLEQLVYVNVRLMDYFLPGIMSVVYGQAAPAAALAALDEEE